MGIKTILVLLTFVWVSYVCGQTAFALVASTHTDPDDDIVDQGELDTEDLTNGVVDAAIPTAIASGSSYLVIRELIRYYFKQQRRNSSLDEKKNQYRKFLDYVAEEINYKSGKFQIKNHKNLNRNLHIWYDLTCHDLPVELNLSINEILRILDKSFENTSEKEGNELSEVNLHVLESKFKDVRDKMCRDVRYDTNYLSKIRRLRI